jgi:hypothetical protein
LGLGHRLRGGIMIAATWDWRLPQQVASDLADLVQWANEEFGADGWQFKASSALETPVFVDGWCGKLLITVLITSWVVSWIVIDHTQPWNEQVIDSGRIPLDGGQP